MAKRSDTRITIRLVSKRWVTLTVSAKGQKVIDARGIERVVAEIRARGERV